MVTIPVGYFPCRWEFCVGKEPDFMEICTLRDFPEAFALLEEAFPDTEIRTMEGQRALLSRSHYRLLLERAKGGSLSAVLAVWEFSSFRYVEHIAVSPAARGQGLGARLLTAYLSESPSPVFLEVEPPETETARRRIGFYRRLGFHLNKFPYVQPPLREGKHPLPLCVMSWPEPVDESAFQPVRAEIYRAVFGLSSGNRQPCFPPEGRTRFY